MNMLLPTIGSAGDVHPMIGLGQTLQRRGHHVTVIAGITHEESVCNAGLEFEALGTRAQAEALLANPDLWHPRRGFDTIARGAILPSMRPVYELIARQNSSDTVVAAQTLALGARLAHEKLGIPLVTIHLSPALFRSVHEMPINGAALPDWMPRPVKHLWWWFADRMVIDPALAGGLNAFRAELGLPPIQRIFHGWLHSPQRVLGLFPEWYAPPQPDWPPQTRLTGFPLYDVGEGSPLPESLRRFLDAGEPPLVFTFGSAMQHGKEHFEAAIAATQQLGRRAVLLTKERSQLPADLPETIHYEPYVPLSDLLPRAALLVHHGGIGTLAQGIATAVPHVVIPLSHDQPDNARRVERLGIGVGLPMGGRDGAALARAADRMLSSAEVKRRCHALAQRVDGKQAREDAATWIEQAALAKALSRPIRHQRISPKQEC